MDKTLRRVTDLKEQHMETYRYRRSRTVGERMEAVYEITRDLSLTRGIDIDSLPSDKTIVRAERASWKAK